VGRRQHAHRAVVVAADPADAAAALGTPHRVRTAQAPAAPPRVALLLPGQGSQYPGMGAGAYDAWPAFREAVDTCADVLAGPLGLDLRTAVRHGDAAALARTALTQPALFAVEYAAARLWASWGVEPAAVVGHSVGELVAATLAGVFTLPDALRLVALRGRLMQAMPPGAMLAVGRDEAEVAPDLPPGSRSPPSTRRAPASSPGRWTSSSGTPTAARAGASRAPGCAPRTPSTRR
jgi:acyl transferase domain-containing protein